MTSDPQFSLFDPHVHGNKDFDKLSHQQGTVTLLEIRHHLAHRIAVALISRER